MIEEQPIVGVALTGVALDVIEEVEVVGIEAVVLPQIPEVSAVEAVIIVEQPIGRGRREVSIARFT